MKGYNQDTDRIMMPSTFRWNARFAKDEREAGIMKYAPLVMKVVNTFDRTRTDIFDKHDLIQSGFVGLIDGYDAIQRGDEDILNVNYLELRIKSYIIRYLNYEATGVAIPEYQIQKHKNEMIADELLGLFKTKIFSLDNLAVSGKTYAEFSGFTEFDYSDSYDNEILNDHLTTMMYQLSERERLILSYSYGVGREKLSMRDIALELGVSLATVEKSKKKALDKLNHEKNRSFIENYL